MRGLLHQPFLRNEKEHEYSDNHQCLSYFGFAHTYTHLSAYIIVLNNWLLCFLKINYTTKQLHNITFKLQYKNIYIYNVMLFLCSLFYKAFLYILNK